MSQLYYLAYGSNLHPLRLRERTPSARLHGLTVLKGYRLAWHKRGDDGSSKCDLIQTGEEGDAVHGAIFTLDTAERILLDRFEGDGYSTIDMEVRSNDKTLTCYSYVATASHISPALQPYHWYRDLVLMGAQYHRFPETYLQAIASTATQVDPHPHRQQQCQQLLFKLRLDMGI